jgi:HAD superfamily phosphatase
VLVFDMDGVLVEVSQSYRETIRETVLHFTGEPISQDTIQDFKNLGGYNNDWLLAHRVILDRGKQVEYADVVDYFNRIFLGENGDGLIRYERWMPRDGLLQELSQLASLAIFTGRAKFEADVTLGRYASDIVFDPLITDETVRNPKPAPDGLFLIQQSHPGKTIWYLGDTVDDARSARAAGVPFIGVSMPQNPRQNEITELLKENGAVAVIEDINDIEILVRQAGSSGRN